MAEVLIGSPDRTAGAAAREGALAHGALTLAVENMHCGGCIRRVETTLLGQTGVRSARVNLAEQRVRVTTDDTRPAPEPLIAALASAGYPATVLVEEQKPQALIASGDLMRRLAVAGFAATNIMLLSVAVWAGRGGDMETSLETAMHWLSAIIALPAVAYAGQPFFKSAASALSRFTVNMDVPISLGVILTTLMSLYQSARGSNQVYFDAATSLLFFLLLGRWLDQRMRARAASAAENLLSQRAMMATVVADDGSSSRRPTREIKPGMQVLVAPGERVAVDARVASGSADLDESLLTGESTPRHVRAGDQIYAGTVNLAGLLTVVATGTEANTLLNEIVELMSTAEQARGRYVRLADRAARLYAPAVHLLSFSTFLGWLVSGHDWQTSLTAAIAVLIITCPCALALAVPAVQVAAVSRLFSSGIIVRAPDALERLSEIDTVILDKTGTLTLGVPRLKPGSDVSTDVLRAAATLAAASRHPYSRAIEAAALARGLTVTPVEGVEDVPGEGLKLTRSGVESRLGSAAFCGATGDRTTTPAIWFRQGQGEPIRFDLVDPIREDAADIVRTLKNAGLNVEIMSGDRAGPVETVGQAVGIDTIAASLRPDAKLKAIKAKAAEGHRVLMVGDGLNDAPALAAAHASIAPSTGVDVSQIAADVVFQGSRLKPVALTIAVARATHRAAIQNFTIAVGYNVLFVPLAMLGLVTPLIAALAMSTSSLAVTANALRMKSTKGELKP